MGICCQIKSVNQIDYLEYHSKATLKILQKDRRGNYKGYQQLTCDLTSPVDQLFSMFNIGQSKYRASGCVIPGLDPHGECQKECQDTYSFTISNGLFFAILFDGHGKEGRKVSMFCKSFMLDYFSSHVSDFISSPSASIEKLVKTCDEELNKSSINCTFSGTTAVVLLMTTAGITVGSLGDSRAILASIPKDNTFLPPSENLSQIRSISPSRLLNAVALTIDQKPNHEEELKRIRKCGGIVERVTNHFGQPIGPYRVWKRKGNLPGLAMSRSIGDKLAHELGVISVPLIHSFEIYPVFDQFIVLASDGIWDVMSNFEVVNLVEKFRNNCKNHGNNYPAKVSNSSIARLLCEEARLRWLAIVEEEDVMIDDISCVVIEIGSIEPTSNKFSIGIGDRNINKFKSIIIEPNIQIEDANASRKDLTRGSIIENEANLESFFEIEEALNN